MVHLGIIRKGRTDMKMWIGLVVLMTLSVLSGVAVRAAEQENKSMAPGTSSTPDTQVKRVTGQLTHIEGWHYTIKDSTEEEVSFGVTSATQDPDKVKEGDHITAMVGEDRIARVIKNMKKKS
jgi:hypothetical protein